MILSSKIPGYELWYSGNRPFVVGRWPHFNPNIGYHDTAIFISMGEAESFSNGDLAVLDTISARLIKEYRICPSTKYLWNTSDKESCS